jgi:hypothetical protein
MILRHDIVNTAGFSRDFTFGRRKHTTMDKNTLKTFERSLMRCTGSPTFIDRFYTNFLADFARQKAALRASLHLMLQMAGDKENGPEHYLKDLAEVHSSRHRNIGADLYELWLNGLLATVREVDPRCNPEIERAWESVMRVGIRYLLAHY